MKAQMLTVIAIAASILNAPASMAAMSQPTASLDSVVAAVRKAPADLNLRRQLAQTLMQNGLAAKAGEQILVVLKAGGQNADDLAAYGDACRYTGDYNNAITSYKGALRLSAMCAKAWSGMSLAYATSGDLATGFQVCQHGLAQITDPMGRQELMTAMSALRSMQLSRAAGASAAVTITQ